MRRPGTFAVMALATLLGSGAGCHRHELPSACLLGGETFDLRTVPAWRPDAPPRDTTAGDVVVRYLGHSGLYLEWRGSGILFSPSFTAGTPVGRVRPDRDAAMAGLEGIPRQRIQAIVGGESGPAHLPTLLDTARLLPAADIFVNGTGFNMLAPYEDVLAGRGVAGHKKRTRVRNIDGKAYPRMHRRWAWMRGLDERNLPIRIYAMPVGARIAPIDEPRESSWKGISYRAFSPGQRYAFVVELLDEARENVHYRVLVSHTDEVLDRDEDWEHGRVDLLALGVRRSADFDGSLTRLIGETQAGHVLMVDYEGAAARTGTLRLHNSVGPLALSPVLCGTDRDVEAFDITPTAPLDNGALDGAPRGLHWSMPIPGQWAVFRARDEGKAVVEPTAIAAAPSQADGPELAAQGPEPPTRRRRKRVERDRHRPREPSLGQDPLEQLEAQQAKGLFDAEETIEVDELGNEYEFDADYEDDDEIIIIDD